MSASRVLGSVMRIFVNQIDPVKYKYVVLVERGQEQCLLINTENRKAYQCLAISANDYPFLKGKDRYISCSQSFRIAPEDLDRAADVGQLTPSDLQRIADFMGQSNGIPPLVQDRIKKGILGFVDNSVDNAIR